MAMFFNYGMARRAVFLSRAPHRQTLPRYALLVLVNGFVSYALLTFLNTRFGMDVMGAKSPQNCCFSALTSLCSGISSSPESASR